MQAQEDKQVLQEGALLALQALPRGQQGLHLGVVVLVLELEGLQLGLVGADHDPWGPCHDP